jgi:hypothetical protein
MTSIVQKTLNVADFAPPFAVAEIFTVVVALAGLVLARNVALALPAGTVTVAGIDATAALPLTTASETTVF